MAVETKVEWCVIDTGIPGDPEPIFNRNEGGVYFADDEADARAVLRIRHAQGANAWLETRTTTSTHWERAE